MSETDGVSGVACKGQRLKESKHRETASIRYSDSCSSFVQKEFTIQCGGEVKGT